jgi:hypothetical protein
MPINARTFLLWNGHSHKEEFKRVANPPMGIAFGGRAPVLNRRGMVLNGWGVLPEGRGMI